MSTTFLDLLRAKVAIHLGLVDTTQARACLQQVDQGQTAQQVLAQEHGVSQDVLQRIDRYAQRCHQLKGESIYLRLLRSRGLVPEETLHPILWEVRQSKNGQSLGETLVARGLIGLDQHQGIQSEARGQLAQEDVSVAERYRQRAYEGIERGSQTVAQIVAEDQAQTQTQTGQTAAPTSAPPRPAPLPPTPPLPQAPPLPQPPSALMASEDELTTESLQPPPKLPPELANSGLEEKYDIERKCGEGGMGAVYLAYSKDDPDHETPLALKVVLDVAKSKDAAARFKREILATSMCAHENIIEIHDAAETQDGSYYMAMEYLEGEELADTVKREGPLPLSRFLPLLDQVLQGLVAIHDSNIVHRDIKPQNFRITKDAQGNDLLKIVDFGIARVLDAADSGAGEQFYKTMGGKITGSPAYIAPESITEPEVDGRADLYSLGISIFRVATGRLPFVAKEPTEYLPMHLYQKPPRLSEMLPGTPPAMDEFVDRLLKKVADQRFASTDEALRIFREKVWPAVLPNVPVPGSEAAASPAPAPGPAPAPPAPLPAAPAPLPTSSEPPPAPAPIEPSPLAPPADLASPMAPDNLGFTAPDMVAPTAEEIDAAVAEGAGQPNLPATVPPAKKLGFFARIWAWLFGKK